MKKVTFLSLLIIIIVALSGCNNSPKEHTKQTFAYGTIINLKMYGENGEKAITDSINIINKIQDQMSVTIGSSEVNAINNNAGIKPTLVSKDVLDVIAIANKYSSLSDGAFDITVQPLVGLWNIGTEKAKVPSKDEITATLPLINYNNIQLKDNTVYLSKTGMEIDLGGIGKGYAADMVKKVAQDAGVTSAYLDLGGNINLIGSKPDGSDWKIGIRDPNDDSNSTIGVLNAKDQSIVSSGTYERYFEEDGIRYHHILDPKTGMPSNSDILSTTIVSSSSTDADVLSTTTFILGTEKALTLVNSLPDVEAIIIDKNNQVHVTNGLQDKFKLTNNSYHLATKE